MNLFDELNKIMGIGTDVTIVVRKAADDKMVVSTSFRNDAVKDEAKNLLQPFLLKGSPAELDEGFVREISTPLQESAGLQTSMQEFETAKKVAESKSAALAEQKKKEAEEAKKKKEQYKKFLDAAKTAQNERKWKDAITALTEAKKYAEQADIAKIEEGIQYCQNQDVPDLFGAMGAEPEGESPISDINVDTETGEVVEEPENEEGNNDDGDLPEDIQ